MPLPEPAETAIGEGRDGAEARRAEHRRGWAASSSDSWLAIHASLIASGTEASGARRILSPTKPAPQLPAPESEAEPKKSGTEKNG